MRCLQKYLYRYWHIYVSSAQIDNTEASRAYRFINKAKSNSCQVPPWVLVDKYTPDWEWLHYITLIVFICSCGFRPLINAFGLNTLFKSLAIISLYHSSLMKDFRKKAGDISQYLKLRGVLCNINWVFFYLCMTPTDVLFCRKRHLWFIKLED